MMTVSINMFWKRRNKNGEKMKYERGREPQQKIK
jgi:hypothetical protein